jgi:hypothetical protein
MIEKKEKERGQDLLKALPYVKKRLSEILGMPTQH